MVRALWMTNQHVVKPFVSFWKVSLCYWLALSSVLLSIFAAHNVQILHKFANIMQICKYCIHWQMFRKVNLAQTGSVFWRLHGAKEAFGSIFTMRRICILKWLLFFCLRIMPQSPSPLAVRQVFKRVYNDNITWF